MNRTNSLTYTDIPVIKMEMLPTHSDQDPPSYGDPNYAYIARLPPELVAMEILEELEYEEILSLCASSKQFRSLCKENYVKEILKRKEKNPLQRLLRRFPKQARYQIKGKNTLQTLPEIFETHFDYEYQRMAASHKHDFEEGIYEEMPSPASIAESALYFINLDRSIALPSCNEAIKEKGYKDLRIRLTSTRSITGKLDDKILRREGKNYYAQAYYASFEPSLPLPSDATYEEIRTMVLDKARDSGKNLLDDLQQIEDALTIRADFALGGFVTAPVDVYICLHGFRRMGGIIINIFAIYPIYSSLRYDEETIFGYEDAVKFVQEFSTALNRAQLLFWGNEVVLSPDNLPIITKRVVFVDNFSDYPYIESGYERPWKLPYGEGMAKNPLFNLYYLSNVFKGKLYSNGGSVQDFKLADFMTPEEIEEANRLYRN